MQVRVRHFLDAKLVEHLVVGRRLQTLELVDRDLSVVNRNEVHKILVLLNIDV